MTPLPAFDEQVVERRDLPEYEIPGRCCNPRCPNRTDDTHEIRPRSQTAGKVWWIELVGRYLIGNCVGICRSCHETNDAHTSAILWDQQASTLVWVDLTDQWAEPLDPMPPIHRQMDPKAGEMQTAAHEAKVFGLDPPASPDPPPVELAKGLQNLDAFLETIQQTDTEPPVEDADFTVIPPEPDLQPNEPLQSKPEPELVGDDQATVDRAKLVTEEAERQARIIGHVLAPPASPWRADVVVYPDELRVEVLHGDLRVGTFLDETIAKAKRAPKPRPPKPPEDPDRPRQATKAKRTWSIAVPLDERDGDRVAAGEDGYTLIENGLELARDKVGRDDHPGWKYFVLVDVINWFNLNWTSEGED